MLQRWLRRAAKYVGIRMRFPGVICVNGTQFVSIDSTGVAHITMRRSLVFLEAPQPGDLQDQYPLDAGEAVIEISPDAIEVSRTMTGPGRLAVSWLPRHAVALYAITDHETGWRPATIFNGSVICIEHECDMRTGSFTIELVAPSLIETAVLFRRPRWPRRMTERHVARMALQHVKTSTSLAHIVDAGTRVVADIQAPRVGDRYVLVVFRQGGVADCEEWLYHSSFIGRAKAFLRTLVPARG